jgi:hypothetical protein
MTITAERYGELRRLHDSLVQRLYGTLSQRALDSTARRLELQRQLEDDYERALVLESALCDEIVGGKSAIGRFLARPELTVDERALLVAMRDARATVFQILEPAMPFGVRVRDVLGGDVLVVADASLTELASPGDHGAARLMRVGEVALTTGVPLNIPPYALALLARAGALPASAWEPKPRALIAARFYRLSLADDEQVQPLLASMALEGKDPLSLALGRALTAPRP